MIRVHRCHAVHRPTRLITSICQTFNGTSCLVQSGMSSSLCHSTRALACSAMYCCCKLHFACRTSFTALTCSSGCILLLQGLHCQATIHQQIQLLSCVSSTTCTTELCRLDIKLPLWGREIMSHTPFLFSMRPSCAGDVTWRIEVDEWKSGAWAHFFRPCIWAFYR